MKSSLEQFISNQKIIRIFTNNMPGFGNQAASSSVIDWLRQNKMMMEDIGKLDLT